MKLIKEKKPRRLVAIMFTDIVGYTALMQADEALAAKVRTRHRQVFNQEHELHNGEIIQYYGDGTLSVFQSVIEAVKCAIVIQQELQKGELVPLRIGIHLGDIVFDGTEVYGDGVNLTSRIEHLGIAGAVLISESVNKELKNHNEITTVSLGHFELKNIANPIEIFAVTNEGINIPMPTQIKGQRKEQTKTIAVLPFINMSTSEDNEYFSDGITEEIINALAKIKQLKVTSRTSSFSFKNQKIPIKQIGQHLNVSTILEGSVRLSGNMMRITAQLINVEDDFHFWAETWDRKLENVFAIQDEISLLIADKLREHLGHFEIQDQLVAAQTDNIEAYENYLKGKYHYQIWSQNHVQLAITFFKKAIALDVQYAEAYATLSYCYIMSAQIGFLPAKEAFAEAESYINQALKLNNSLSELYLGLASLSFWKDWNFKKAFFYVNKVLEINPSNSEAYFVNSFVLFLTNKREAAFKQIDLSINLDPLSAQKIFTKGWMYYMEEEYAKAKELLQLCLDKIPNFVPAILSYGCCLLLEDQPDAVIEYYNSNPSEAIDISTKLGMPALAYALKNDQVNKEKMLQLLYEQLDANHVERAAAFIFMIHAASGNHDEAFEWIQKGIDAKSPLILFLTQDPLIKPIFADKRYVKLVEKLFSSDATKELPAKKKTPFFDETLDGVYTQKLEQHIESKAPYLDPNLSLRNLAEQINLHPNQLSWLLNEKLGKNFNAYINHFRVEAFKQLVKDPKNAHITLIGLAFESGFNSKTVFNTYFKKETGMTPKQYVKQLT